MTFFEISEVSETSMTWKFFCGSQDAEYSQPSVQRLTPATTGAN